MKKLLLALFVVGLCLSGASDVKAETLDYADAGSSPATWTWGQHKVFRIYNVLSEQYVSKVVLKGVANEDDIYLAIATTSQSGPWVQEVDCAESPSGTYTCLFSQTVDTEACVTNNSCYFRARDPVNTYQWGVQADNANSILYGSPQSDSNPPTTYAPRVDLYTDTGYIPPTPTTPTPTNGFTETFDTASTTAGTALNDTWGQIGWIQPSSGSGEYTVTATGTAPSSPNVASPSGTKSVGFYVATSTKIYYESEIFMGTNTDFSFNIWQNGVVGSSISGTDQLNVNLCTRSSCGLGVPQITISSVGSLFSCTLLQATSTYTGDSWTDFKLLFDADNGTVDVYVGTTRFSTICNNSFTIASPIVEISPTASIDNVYVALDGDAPVLPTDPLAPPDSFIPIDERFQYSYYGAYKTRFLDIEVATVASSTEVTLDYFLSPDEYDATIPAKNPQTIRLQLYHSTSTSEFPQIPQTAEYTRDPTTTGTTTQTIPLDIWGEPLTAGNYELHASFSNTMCFFGRATGSFVDCPFYGIGVQIAFTINASGTVTILDESYADDVNESGELLTDQSVFHEIVRPINIMLYQKHPTAWIFQFFEVMNQASQREMVEATTTIDLPFFVALTDIAEDTWLTQGLEDGFEISGELSEPIPFTLVEDGCHAIDDIVFADENSEEIISCTTFRNFVGAAMWLGFLWFCWICVTFVFSFKSPDITSDLTY